MQHLNRRQALKTAVGAAGGLIATGIPPVARSEAPGTSERSESRDRIRFAVIGLNHGHIYGQTDAVMTGGGELVSFYATEPELIAPFQE
ncbi:MAG: twin-arginine translocation signal domain-containing protein, partial [Rhodothermales bacterium]